MRFRCKRGMKKNDSGEDSGRRWENSGRRWERQPFPRKFPAVPRKFPAVPRKFPAVPSSSQSFFCGRGQPRSGCAMFVQGALRNC